MGARWTAEEIAAHVGVSVPSVYRYRRQGDLPAALNEGERPLEWDARRIRRWATEWFRHHRDDPEITDEEWWGYEEIADFLGVKPVTAQRYRSRRELPEPDRFFGRSPVWRPEVIIQWVKERPSGKFKDRSALHRQEDETAATGAPVASTRKKAVRSARPRKKSPAEGGERGAWWGYREIAEYLGVTEDTVRRYRSNKEMPHEDRKFGRSPVWLPEVITEWAAERPSATWKNVGGRPRKDDQAASQ